MLESEYRYDTQLLIEGTDLEKFLKEYHAI